MRDFLFRIRYDVHSETETERIVEYNLVRAHTPMEAEQKIRKRFNIPVVCFNMTVE